MATIIVNPKEELRRLEELLAEKEGLMTAAWDDGRRGAASRLFDECCEIRRRLNEIDPSRLGPGLPPWFVDDDPDGDHACGDLK